jgi:hypothetical protein
MIHECGRAGGWGWTVELQHAGALAALPGARMYRLTVELEDASVAWFSDIGSALSVRGFEVGQPHAITAGS